MAEREEKKRAMELAIAQIEKQFGKGSIMKLGATEAPPPDVPVIPSGSLGLDLALGTGGLPRGRVIEIFGPESSGKTTLMLHTIAEAQKTGGTAAFIDAEHALDLTYAEKLGVNTADLLVSQPDTGGNALKFYASVRLDIRRIESIKEGQDVTGSRVRVKVVKNKMAPPFKQAEFDVLFAEGVSKVGELIDLGVDRKIVDKSGAWFSYGGERIGQGREAARDYLKAHPAVAREIEIKIREAAGVGSKDAAHARPAAEKRPDDKRSPTGKVVS